jgi:transposase
VFLDESGFLLIPTRSRTWGPRGKTPLVRFNYRHDRISALAALSISPKRTRLGLYARFQQENFKAVDVCGFLRTLLHHLRGHVILLLDSAKIHKGPTMARLTKRCRRLHLEWFPAYAPELNPVEFVWRDFKRRSATRVLRDKQDIRLNLHGNARRVRGSQDKLRSFVLASDLPSTPWT